MKNMLRVTSQKYLNIFKGYLENKNRLHILMDENGFAKKETIGDNKGIQYYVQYLCERIPRITEVFYTVSVFAQKKKITEIYIPQVELSEIFEIPEGQSIFSNVESVTLSPLTIKEKSRRQNR